MLKNDRFTSPIVSADWLNNHMNLERLVILDVGADTIDEINSEDGFISKARFINIKKTFCDTQAKFPNTIPSEDQFQKEARELGINRNSTIVIYDAKGIYWSARLYWLFKTFGYDTIAVLDGGLPEWKRLGFATVSSVDNPNWDYGNFSAAFQNNKMYDFKDISELSVTDHILVLDARSSERFQSMIPEPRVGLRSGRIPNSKNLPYTDLLDGNCLKSKTELQTIFDTFEIGTRALVFSCGSGITACILAIAAEICDYNKLAVYDGSWTEYGTLTT